MARKPKIKSKAHTKVIDRGFKGIIKELQKLEKKPFVKVGFPAEMSQKDQFKTSTINEGTEKIVSKVTVLDVAIWMEFGTEVVLSSRSGATTVVIPERSFIRSAFDKHRSKYEAQTKKFLVEIYSNRMTVDRALAILGLMMENDIKDMIKNGEFEPLAISTILRKGSDKPLIDTSQMLNSLRFKVRMDGGTTSGKLGKILRAGSTSTKL